MTISAPPILVGDMPPVEIAEMSSYAVDMWFDDLDILVDEPGMMSLMREAAVAGGATVLGSTSAVFANGAVTGVLLLAQSHLNVHTWPEFGLANFDLLTCGPQGGHIVEHLTRKLAPVKTEVVRTVRHLHAADRVLAASAAERA